MTFTTSRRSRGPFLVAVVAGHAALLMALWAAPSRPRLNEGVREVTATQLHLLAPVPTRPSRRAPSVAPTPAPDPRRPEVRRPVAPDTPGIPNTPDDPTPAPSPSSVLTVVPPAPPASAPLNLALPPAFRGQGPMVPARQAQADPRANSPRPTLGDTLFGSTGGATERIETATGAQLRGPQGSCLQVTRNTWAQMNPMDPNAQALPAKVHDCSKLAPGARRHARPP